MGIPVVEIFKWAFTNSKNGNGNGASKQELLDYKVEETKGNLKALAETANHNFTALKEQFEKHTEEDKEFFKEQRTFNEKLWEKITKRR